MDFGDQIQLSAFVFGKIWNSTFMTAPTDASREIVVAAGVIEKSGRILISRRKQGTHLGGLWEFPGGKKQSTETLQACLKRELHEELGVFCVVGRELGVHRHTYPEKSVILHFFSCRLLEGDPKPLDCAEIRWITLDELDGYSFPEADNAFLSSLKQYGVDGLWFWED